MSRRKSCRVAGRGLRPVMADHRNKIRRATQQERKEQMDGKDKLLWRCSTLVSPSRVKVMRGMFPFLQPDVLNSRTMESSINGCTAGGCARKTIKLKCHPPSHEPALYRLCFNKIQREAVNKIEKILLELEICEI
ncbi:hypothetical protein D9C73_025639 [Collichthys lucidus]|uniref:Uncharacterized protein n=1 Tax=Collichthys lucidus TaxID=240159 RepID=A0A4U5VVW1_COLLU|nr:hypothetical protein D9C73_025639 [Collichthys lucidus]